MATITTIDDAAAFGTEALHRLLRRQCQADDVDFQLPPQFGFCDRSEGSELIDAGVVDKHIMAPESTHGLRKQTLDVRALQHDPRPARNISSTASTNNEPATVVYSATKSAVDAITRALARELGPKKIRVNAINPGATDTEGYQRMGLVGSAFGTNCSHIAWAARTPARHCRRRGLSRLRRGRVDHRREHSGLWRLAMRHVAMGTRAGGDS